MKRTLTFALLGLALAACHDRYQPHMCAFAADERPDGSMGGSGGGFITPETWDAGADSDATSTCPTGFQVAAGQGFYVVYQMPAGINASDPIQITLTTPCGTTTVSRDHADDVTRVIIPLTAPPGSACALTITATLANSELTQVAKGDSKECVAEKLRCPVVDAGTGGASTGTTSSTGTGGAAGG
jgi:hypothetical protein